MSHRNALLNLSILCAGLTSPAAPALAQLDEEPPERVLITASLLGAVRTDLLGSSATILDPIELENRQTRIVSDVLRDVPGVAVNRLGPVGQYTQIRLRGAEGDHTLALIDGIKVSDPFAGGFDFGTLIADEVARVEVLRGEQSALYGSDAIGGVIHYITLSGAEAPGIRARAEGGSFGTANTALRVAGVADALDYALNAAFNHTDGTIDNAQGTRELRAETLALSGKFTYAFAENFRVRAEKLSTEQALRRSQEHQEAMARAEAHQRTLIEELNHRVKNMLTVVNAMARQTLASNPAPEDFSDKFVRRIDALGRTHALLSREQWGTVQMADIARESLEHFLVEDKKRVMLEGPPVALDPKTAVALGIVFHELATNAVKHGALSNDSGTVSVSWTFNGDETVELQWQEDGGPEVRQPSRAGFGSRLIKLELTHELNGGAELIYEKSGLRVAMEFPLINASPSAQLKQGIAQ